MTASTDRRPRNRNAARILVVLSALIACASLSFAGVIALPGAAAATGAATGPANNSAAMQTRLTNFTPDGRQATRFDTAGNPVDAHDGTIAQFGDTYYLYGTSYDCGYQWQHNRDFCGFTVYSSPDLQSWTDRGYVAGPRQCTYCFRPHVVYNAATHQYVMWVNDQDAMDNFRVYTAPSPLGPFTEAPVPDLPAATPCTADLGLFVDTDGTGYLTCSNAGWHIAVLQLTPDYLQPDGRYSVLGVTKVEAPSLFERDGRYYLTMSDPNCGYCAATGTSYVSAPTPLGPWTGTDAWTVSDGTLHVRGGLYGLSEQGADWTDYTFSADVAPRPETTGSTVQAGWSVRMNSPDKGYLFLLHGTPTSNGKLDVLVRNGSTVKSHTVSLPYKILAGAWHQVSVTASGSTFTTSIDGAQVDSFTDTTFARGGVGFREYNGANVEAADFDNAKVVGADGTALLSDEFSSPDLAQWVPPLAGIKISLDSCGGQPSFVSRLTGADGSPSYLYGSDLWDFHTNEALANYYWEPLRFGPDGAIAPLQCGNSSIELPGNPAAGDPMPGQDQSSGSAAFAPTCPITASARYGQTFTVGRSGTLTTVAANVFRDGTEDGRVLRNPPTDVLQARIATVRADGSPGATLWTSDVAPEQVGWSGRQVVLQPRLHVQRGERLALVLSTPSVQGCYGVETDPTDPYVGGTALAGGPADLTPVAGTDLKFATTVDAPPPRTPPTRPQAATTVLGPTSGDVPVLAGEPTRAVLSVANLTGKAISVPVSASASPGYAVDAPARLSIGVGETAPLALTVRRTAPSPAAGELSVRAGAGTLSVPITPTDDVVRTATMGASSTHDGWSPAGTNDGQTGAQHDYASWNAGAGWNDADKGVWPDTLTATWPAPVSVSRVDVLTLDAGQAPASTNGLRDYDVQALVDGTWSTVASVRGATAGTIESTFAPVRTAALRLLITDSNDHGYSRVIELEGYAS